MKVIKNRLALGAFVLALLLAACSTGGAPTPSPTAVILPTATPAATETAVPLPTIELSFSDQVVNAFNTADYEWINAHMGSEFTFAGWQAGGSALPPAAAVDQLRTVHFGSGSQPVFQANTNTTALLGGVDPLSLWGPDVTATNALYLTGLGSSAQDEALLILAVSDVSTLYIFGLLSAFGGFAAYPTGS